MAKKRKKNYRLRKSVRRTLGALFMISAIVIAAIPFPDAAATDGMPTDGTANGVIPLENTEKLTAYTYTIPSDNNTLFFGGVDLVEQGTKYQALTTRKRTSGAYEIFDQFEFCEAEFKTEAGQSQGTYGYITRYNDLYATERVELTDRVNKEYYTVPSATYEAYFTAGGNGTQAITLIPGDVANEALFEKFFSSNQDYIDYKNQKQALDEWQQKYNAATTLEEQAALNAIKPTTSTPPTLTPSVHMNPELRPAYYCYKEMPEISNAGYTLMRVLDKRTASGGSSSSIDQYIYIAHGGTPPDAGWVNDENGFLVKSTASIIAIGENAFKNVTKVFYMTLPAEINYIADNAFLGSFMIDVTLEGVRTIGNHAFQGSTQLKTINVNGLSEIGTEAFAGCTALENIAFPYAVKIIGDGAFANCDKLQNVDLSVIQNLTGGSIGKGAFFNCPLSNLNFGSTSITSIGDGAFASNKANIDKLTKVSMSDCNNITTIGDAIFSGRKLLESVTMPGNYGSSSVTLKENTFAGCSNLKELIFNDFCGQVKYESYDIFSDITNDAFAVYGPAKDSSGAIAQQRKDTRESKNANGNPVPYVYVENGTTYYEVKNGDYLLGLMPDSETTAVVTKCDFVEGTTSTQTGELKIPPNVGPYKITKLEEGCFSQPVKDDLRIIDIADDSLLEIGDGVFEGCKNLETLTIGNSVQSIGSSAFKGCTSLTEAILGENLTSLKDSAFEGCTSLTEIIFEQPPQGVTNFPVENIGVNALTTGSEKLTVTGAIAEGYGPFEWAMNVNNYVDKELGIRVCYKSPEPQCYTVILDNQNNLATLVDYLHYGDLANYTTVAGDKTILQQYEEGLELTPHEEALVNSALKIDLPSGIESIDAKGYYTDSSKQMDGVIPKSNKYNILAYFDDNSFGSRRANYEKYGLFAGSTDDVSTSKLADETKEQGNDRIQEVKMATVKYLPTNTSLSLSDDPIADNGLATGAFYSCEDLRIVELGSAMEDIGTLPFKGCYNLNSISDVGPYVCENGIIYKQLGDGSYEVVEALGGKAGTVDATTDSKLVNTSSIAVGAFSDCPKIDYVNFKDLNSLKEIPDKCFLGADELEVLITDQIRLSGSKAFAESNWIILTIEGTEVGLAMDSFENTDKAKVYAYEDSAAYNSAVKAGADVEAIGETYTAKFVDHDGSEFEGEDYAIQEGIPFMGYAKDPKIDFENKHKREGYIWTGWYPDYTTTPITKNQEFVAQYVTDEDFYKDPETNNPGTNDPGTNTPGTSDPGTSNPGTSNPGSTDKPGTNVNGGIDLDGDGIPDVDADGNKLYKLTVTNGEGSGYYPAGKTVTIKAGNAPGGTAFAYWSCSNESLIFNDRTDWITTLTMIGSDVTVICNFTGQYTLEVEYGSGSGSYPAGAKVAISAVEAPQGRKFASWVTKTNGLNIENSKKESTIITMPASHAKITATYMDTGSISGNSSTSKNNTSIVITKPGISDKNTASAYVSGSTDNFIVKISESLDAADEVQKALQKKYSDMSRIKYFAMDISLYDAKGVNKITDTTGLKVNITIPIPDALREYAGNNRVGAVVNGELETLNPKFTTINGVPSVTFTATHFSPYTIYVDTGNMTVSSVPDSTPKTGDGIHPKWFLSIGLACISIILFTKKDRRYTAKAYR